jgi:Flp pilus assembly protein TadG
MRGDIRAICGRDRRRAHQGGAVAVEFALIAPIVIMLLIGTVTTGVSYSKALGITNAVREGARFGAIAETTTGTWPGDVAARVRDTQFDDAKDSTSETSICVEFYRNGSLDSGLSACNDASGPMVSSTDLAKFPVPSVSSGCVVRVVATRNFTISAPPLVPPMTRKMVRGSVARYERKTC